ncbi:hypothetical protein WDJ51_10920 [Rathayibacter sp. YIM 133350]|uniref:ABC transporter permease n=1 Tax=Rathayibacter sp. YIM 133350 TaxID=3131992 RepID=UPI00307E360B
MSTLWPLLRQRLLRDRWQLLSWALGIAVLSLVGHSAVAAQYGTEKDRAEVIRLLIQTPSVLVLRGTPQGTQTDAFQFMLLYGFTAILVALMATFLAVRHSRGDEEAGRAELVESTPAGRLLPLVATSIEGILATAVLSVLYATGFALYGARAEGVLLAGLAMATNGVVFLGIGLLCAQLMRTSRGANALAATIAGAAYLVRGVADARGTVNEDGLSMTPSGLMWASPSGWGALTLPFSRPNWSPLLVALIVGVALFAVVFALRSQRDLDASLVPERRGRLTAPATLAGPIGLTVRQLRNAVIGWAIAAGLLGLFVGGLAQVLTEGVGGDLQENLGHTVGSLAGPNAQGTFADVFIVAMFAIMGALAAVAGVQTIVRARQDEASGTVETVLSAPVSRVHWFGGYLLLALVSAVTVLAAGMAGTFIGAAASGASSERFRTIAEAALAQLPAALLLAAIVAVVFALLPRWTIALGWAIVLVAIFIGQFGGLFGLPDWVRDASPFSHTPLVTADDADWGAAWVMLALGVLAAAASVALVRRRDLALGG